VGCASRTRAAPPPRQLEPRQVELRLARLEVAGVVLTEADVFIAVDNVVEQARETHDARASSAIDLVVTIRLQQAAELDECAGRLRSVCCRPRHL
jgi:hypothetical protein